MRIPTIIAAACLLLASCQQEEGCTDPVANNYDPNAVADDGSCTYDGDPGGALGEPIIDGYTYDVVTIGEQVWFAENLRTTVYANGDPISSLLTDEEWISTTAGAMAVYGEGDSDCYHASPDIDACDEEQSLEAYGRLYNWYAVDDERGLCPTGWHVPTDEEWTELEEFVASQGFEESQAMALRSTTGWADLPDSTSGNGTDDFGFAGLPGGFRNYSILSNSVTIWGAGYYCDWWSSSPDGQGYYWLRSIHYMDSGSLNRSYNPAVSGFSVRCLKDAE